MWQKLCVQGSNWCCRIGLGLAICSALVVLVSTNNSGDLSYHSQAFAAGSAVVYESQIGLDAKLEQLARENPIELLKLALENYQNSVSDYTCRFVKQERINGHMKEAETIRVLFKEAPFSVLMSWPKPKGLVEKILYVEKDGNRTLLIRPAGLAGLLVNTVKRHVDDPSLKKSSLRTPRQFGFGRSLQDMLDTYEVAQKNGDLVLDYLGSKQIDGREYLLLQRTLPMDKGYDTLYSRLVVYLDKDYLLPTRLEGYDTADNLVARYRYFDLVFNRGLTDNLFKPKAHGLDG